MDFGSALKAFRFRHLSEIRTNGKKATPPCPCGYLGHYRGTCVCTPERIARYRGKLSGPFLDRIDMHVEVPALRENELGGAPRGEPSSSVRARVAAARAVQIERQGVANAMLSGGEIERHCACEPRAQGILREAASRMALTARAFHRILKVARSIADLAGATCLQAPHVAEALQYRPATFTHWAGPRR